MKHEVLAIRKYANLGSGDARPLHSVIKSLRNKHELNWLRIKIVNKCHSNLKEMLLGDLNMKVMAGIEDAVTKTLPCICPKAFLR